MTHRQIIFARQRVWRACYNSLVQNRTVAENIGGPVGMLDLGRRPLHPNPVTEGPDYAGRTIGPL